MSDTKLTVPDSSPVTIKLLEYESDPSSLLLPDGIDPFLRELAKIDSASVRDHILQRFAKVAKLKPGEAGRSLRQFRRDYERVCNTSSCQKLFDAAGFELPDKYGFRSDGVYFFGAKEDEAISSSPVWINSRVLNLTTGLEELELSWVDLGVVRSLRVTRGKIYNTRGYDNLSDLKFPVLNTKSFQLSDYLLKFERHNDFLLEEKKKFIVSTPGWALLPDGSRRFGAYSSDVSFEPDEKVPAFRFLTPSGSFTEWLKLKPIFEKTPMLSFLLATSATAPLLNILNEPGFILDQYGTSQTGKTTSLRIAASAFGAPGGQNGPGLVNPWNQTQTYAENMLSSFSDLPVYFMDSHELKDDDLERMSYMVANGAGRGRGTREGGARNRAEWRSVVLSDGERSMYERFSQDGAKNRVISMCGAAGAGLSQEEFDTVNQIISSNYGHLAPLFISKTNELASELKHVHAQAKSYFSGKHSDQRRTARISAYFASISTAAYVLSRVEGMEWFQTVSAIAIDKAWDLACAELMSENNAEKALNQLVDWFTREDRNFVTSAAARYTIGPSCYGRIAEGEFVAVIPSVLHTFLANAGFKSPKMIIEQWIANGILTSKRDNGQCSERIQGKPTHVYSFKWETLYPEPESTSDRTKQEELTPSIPLPTETSLKATHISGRLLRVYEAQRRYEKITYIELEDMGFFTVTAEHQHLLKSIDSARVGIDIGDWVNLAYICTDASTHRYVVKLNLEEVSRA